MRLAQLNFLMNYKDLNASQIARMCGISRQRVSQWLNGDELLVNIGTLSLINLAKETSINPSFLLEHHDAIEDTQYIAMLESALLWDKLYKNIPAFLKAVHNGEVRAIGRLVEVYGFFAAEKIAGKKVWQTFPKFKHRLPPVRRQELEKLWLRLKELKLILS